MEFSTFQDGMFPKYIHLLLCREQILPVPGAFAIDLRRGLWYDICVGSDFSGLIFLCPPGQEMTPDRLGQGSFLFSLGFDHWVTSLSAGSAGLRFLWESPHSCSSAFRAIGIYIKRGDWKAQPAGVLTIFGITFFRNISLPYFALLGKTGYFTNEFRNFGIKRRNRRISQGKC